MKLRIHRGAEQIGGSCAELEAQGQRLVLDLGLPLDAADDDDPAALLPHVAGFRTPDPSLQGIVLSHLHHDHIVLVPHLATTMPVAIGADARRIVNRAAPYLPSGATLPDGPDLKDGIELRFGPFTVTPVLMDHSAFDAYALLVEADGHRLFYSGDVRGHGRKGALFERLLRRPPEYIDAMLMEGTTLGRPGTERGFPSEADLEMEFTKIFREASGPALVYASAQNIDRMVTVYRAAKRSGRKLVIDLYAAVVLEATECQRIPQLGWDDVWLYVPQRQRHQIVRNKLFPDLIRLGATTKRRLYPEDLASEGGDCVFLFRPLHGPDFASANALDGAILVYSQWEGYLRDGSLSRFQEWIEANNVPMVSIHTSGHASVADLKRLVAAIEPRHLIPIHTFEKDRYAEVFGRATVLSDGEWFQVGAGS